jgi:Effector Associated Constant Component 1
MPQSIELSVSDHAEIGALYNRLREVPDVEVSRTSGQPGAGEQGTLDLLTALGSSTALVTAVRTIPSYLRARRSGISVKTTVKGKDFILTLDNVEDVMPIIERVIQDD